MSMCSRCGKTCKVRSTTPTVAVDGLIRFTNWYECMSCKFSQTTEIAYSPELFKNHPLTKRLEK